MRASFYSIPTMTLMPTDSRDIKRRKKIYYDKVMLFLCVWDMNNFLYGLGLGLTNGHGLRTAWGLVAVCIQ